MRPPAARFSWWPAFGLWLVGGALAPAQSPVAPGTVRWQGGASASWSEAAFWQPARVPVAGDTAVVDGPGPVVPRPVVARLQSLSLGSSRDLHGTFEVEKGAGLVLSAAGRADGSRPVSLMLGEAPGAGGTLTVAGELRAEADLQVGLGGRGRLVIAPGAVAEGELLLAGLLPDAEGAVAVQGDLRLRNAFGVGEHGTGTLSIAAGGRLTYRSRWGVIGSYPEATGLLEVAGTLIGADTSDLIVGNAGEGRLRVSPPGRLVLRRGVIGYLPSARGDAVVAGEWRLAEDLFVGYDARASLAVEMGGRIACRAAVLALSRGSLASATVAGDWSCLRALRVASAGEARLVIEPSGQVKTGTAVVAEEPSARGEVIVSGEWVAGADFHVAKRGTARLTLAAPGRIEVTTGDFVVGALPGANGVVEIAGCLRGDGDFAAGLGGVGEVTIPPGGIAHARRGRIAAQPESAGSVTVAGAWVLASELEIGGAGAGTLVIAAGGAVRAAAARVAAARTARGSVQVRGRWEIAGALALGGAGVAEVSLFEGGHLSASGTRLGGGSTLTFAGGRLTGPLAVDGGTVAVRTTATLAGPLGPAPLLRLAPGATLLLDDGARLIFDCRNAAAGRYDLIVASPGALQPGVTPDRVTIEGLPATLRAELTLSATGLQLTLQ